MEWPVLHAVQTVDKRSDTGPLIALLNSDFEFSLADWRLCGDMIFRLRFKKRKDAASLPALFNQDKFGRNDPLVKYLLSVDTPKDFKFRKSLSDFLFHNEVHRARGRQWVPLYETTTAEAESARIKLHLGEKLGRGFPVSEAISLTASELEVDQTKVTNIHRMTRGDNARRKLRRAASPKSIFRVRRGKHDKPLHSA